MHALRRTQSIAHSTQIARPTTAKRKAGQRAFNIWHTPHHQAQRIALGGVFHKMGDPRMARLDQRQIA